MLAHALHGLGFFNTLAAVPRSPRWDSLAVGAIVLRLAEVALSGQRLDPEELRAARRQVRGVTELVVRGHLQRILDAMSENARWLHDWEQRIAFRLVAYALELTAQRDDECAADVFTVVVVGVRVHPELRQVAERQLDGQLAEWRTRSLYFDAQGKLRDLRELRAKDFYFGSLLRQSAGIHES